MKLLTEINHIKKRLIKKAEKQGLYEDFGQKEVNQLTNKWIDISQYNNEMNYRRDLISLFDKWCMNYTGN